MTYLLKKCTNFFNGVLDFECFTNFEQITFLIVEFNHQVAIFLIRNSPRFHY